MSNEKPDFMNSNRIKEIQLETAYPNSRSVHQALLQVWNECAQQQSKRTSQLEADKAELLMALILTNDGVNDIDMHSKNFALIQKHAAK